jgi:hypothetical protein
MVKIVFRIVVSHRSFFWKNRGFASPVSHKVTVGRSDCASNLDGLFRGERHQRAASARAVGLRDFSVTHFSHAARHQPSDTWNASLDVFHVVFVVVSFRRD